MIVCPTCSFENGEHERHCLRCGRPLEGVQAPEPEEELEGGTLRMELNQQAMGWPALEEEQAPRQEAKPELSIKLPPLNELRQHRATVVEGLKALEGPRVQERLHTVEVAVQSQELEHKPERKPDLSDTSPEPYARVTAVQTALPSVEEEAPELEAKRRRTAPNARAAVESIKSLKVALGVLGALVLLAACTVGWLLREQEPAAPQGGGEATQNTRLAIAGGPFLKGLSKDYRLLFQETCKKIAEEPDTECKEEVALKGEVPQETVTLGPFWLDRLEVSVAEHQACVEAGACQPIHYKGCQNLTHQGELPFLRVPQALQRPDRPVVCLDRAQAQALCRFRGGRLPSHDEWERAARGVDAHLFPWGSNWEPGRSNWGERDMARISVAGLLDGHELTAPVHALAQGRSPEGAYNMAGNVAEWVAPPPGQQESLTGQTRGGSWLSNPAQLRSTARQTLPVDARRTDTGVRCAYDEAH